MKEFLVYMGIALIGMLGVVLIIGISWFIVEFNYHRAMIIILERRANFLSNELLDLIENTTTIAKEINKPK